MRINIVIRTAISKQEFSLLLLLETCPGVAAVFGKLMLMMSSGNNLIFVVYFILAYTVCIDNTFLILRSDVCLSPFTGGQSHATRFDVPELDVSEHREVPQ